MAGASTNILAKLNKGEFVSIERLQKICRAWSAMLAIFA
ncbi:MAG: hypothetical protein SPG48_03230 [Treponema sp.]|nr:hypothetical protein [Treponema sp.]MDY5682550.1 hypothetical protein [Treponema sp.]